MGVRNQEANPAAGGQELPEGVTQLASVLTRAC
jgi:hypothetical protein